MVARWWPAIPGSHPCGFKSGEKERGLLSSKLICLNHDIYWL